jgi:hypothetical protein
LPDYFGVDGDPSHRLQDFDAYYFMATAGSRISVSLERVADLLTPE